MRYRSAEEEGRRNAQATFRENRGRLTPDDITESHGVEADRQAVLNILSLRELEVCLLSLDAEREEVERGDCVCRSGMHTHVSTCSFLRVQEKRQGKGR